MNALLFFLAIATVVSLLAYFLRKTSIGRRTELARKEREAKWKKQLRAERMGTVGNNRLSNSDAVWQARRQHMSLVTESAEKTQGQRFFAYKPGDEPEYDGYSRADRHHVTPAKIKKEGSIDDIVTPANSKFRTESPTPTKRESLSN